MKSTGILGLAMCIIFLFSVAASAQQVEPLVQKGLAAYQQGQKPDAHQYLLDALITIQNEMPLEISKVVFCKEIRGFDDFVPLESEEVSVGTELLIYIEPINVRIMKQPGGKYLVRFSEDMKITNEEGKVMFEKKDWINFQQLSRMPGLYVFARNSFTDVPAGRYTFEITINDQLAQKSVSQTVSLTVK
jgi:hypothetical protein